MTVNAIDHLRKASKLIATAGNVNRALISEAAGHFWSATFDEEHWSLPLRVASTSLKAKLLAEGTIVKTIQSLDSQHLALLADEMSRFCLDVIEDSASHSCPPEPHLADFNPMTFDEATYSTS